jgi:hypothetical protein
MKLTIIPSDKAVYVNGVSYLNLDLSSCNIPSEVRALQWDSTSEASSGWIEFLDYSDNQPITELPAWAVYAQSTWEQADYNFKNPPPPTEEQLITRAKYRAEQALQESDWAVLPDVPLVNKAEWETYRAALRDIAINPTSEPVWPTKPATIWS